jgi:nucleoid-associated protein EbfC
MAKGFKGGPQRQQMGGGGGMMAQIQKLQEQVQLAQEQIAKEVVTYSAGGGAIKIAMTGDQHCQSVVIDPALLQETDVEMLQDLILTAVNGALDATRELTNQRMGPLTGGLPF